MFNEITLTTSYFAMMSPSTKRVCIISVVSRTALDSSIREQLVDAILSEKGTKRQSDKLDKRNTPNSTPQYEVQDICDELSLKDELEIQVTSRSNTNTNTVVLSLSSYLETNKLVSITEAIDSYLDTSESDAGLEVIHSLPTLWPILNQNLLKSLLILFVMSHIIVFYNPEPSIDYNLIRMFKLLEMLRLKSQSRITDLLETMASNQILPSLWVRQARLTCPRALFICDTTNMNLPFDVLTLKHDLEDQIYNCLKRSNIINRQSSGTKNQPTIVSQMINSSALISIPEREDFVFVLTRFEKSVESKSPGEKSVPKPPTSETFGHDIDGFLRLLSSPNSRCNETQVPLLCLKSTDSKFCNLTQSKILDLPPYQISKFKKFINKHIADINHLWEQQERQSSNSKHHSTMKPSLVLPKYDDFFQVLDRLKNLIFHKSDLDESSSVNLSRVNPWRLPDERRFIDIYNTLNVDENFSRKHCIRIARGALEHYIRIVRGTPVITSDIHEAALVETRKKYKDYARGPCREQYLTFLDEACMKYRDQNRGVVSKGNEAIISPIRQPIGFQNNINREGLPLLRSQTNNQNEHITIARRANGIKLATVCECGRKSSFTITPVDRKKKLDRVDVHKLND